MTKVLAYPFQITPGGRIATVEHDSVQAKAQQLEVLIRTRTGERVLVPAFGLPDPAFRGLQLDDIRTRVELFGPNVTVTEVIEGPIVGAQQEVEVRFE